MAKKVSFCLAVCLVAALPAHPQEPARTVVITVLRAEGDDTELTAMGKAATDTLALMLRLVPGFDVIRHDFLYSTISLETMERYYNEVKAEKAVYGTVRRTESGGFGFSVDIWSARDPQHPRRVAQTVDGAGKASEIAEEAALRIASAVAEREVELGVVAIRNTESLGAFTVYVDRQSVAHDAAEIRIPIGEHDIIVAKSGPFGDQALEGFHVMVEVGKTAEVALERKQEKAEAGSAAAPKEEPPAGPVQETGTLRVVTAPDGASVALAGKVLGKTPLELYGVPAGRYELVLERELFRSVVKPVEIQAGGVCEVSQDLEVDEKAPKVQAALVSPEAALWGAIGCDALQAGFLLAGILFDSHYYTSLFVGSVALVSSDQVDSAILMSMRLGHFIAGDPAASLILTGINIGSVALSRVLLAIDNEIPDSPLIRYVIPSVLCFPQLLTLVYDIVISPFAANAANARTLDAIHKTGRIPSAMRYTDHHWIIETGGGTLLSAGYLFTFVEPILYAGLLGGIALKNVDPIAMAPAINARLAAYPMGDLTGAIRPYITVGITGETDFSAYGLAASIGMGFEGRLPWLDFYTLSQLSVGLLSGSKAALFTVGVRL